jgi:Raf kinase inhibitor-like YbhB/YbcL family protein
MMQVSSPAFANRRLMPDRYSCRGDNVSPQLMIKGVPPGAASLALVVHDPDAPAGDWTHWTLWNVSPKVTGIAEASVPAGAVEGVTDFGRPGYGGPCPPSGTHRYFFGLYALDTMLDLQSAASRADLEAAMEGHVLAKAELVGLFSKN